MSSTCFANTVKCYTTTYNPTKRQCGNTRNITRSGVKGQRGVCAADWKVFPVGSILYCIDTGEIFVVGDTGGKVKGYHIDRWRKSPKENKYCVGGTLSYYVLYKPAKNAPRSKWKKTVETSLTVRNRLAFYRKHQLKTKDGREKIRTKDIPRIFKELSDKKKDPKKENRQSAEKKENKTESKKQSEK